jgi:hypothetical protein
MQTETRQLFAGPRPAVRFVTGLWWLVVMGVIAGGAVGYAVTSTAGYVYQSVAVVVGTTELPTDSFGNAARAVFGTNTVIQPVIDQLGLGASPGSLLSAGRLAIEPVSGAIAVKIIGQASDPEAAEALAGTAASSFVTVAANYGLGALKTLSASRAVRQSPAARRNAVVSAIAGGLLVSAALLLIFLVREPVVDEGQAREALRAQTSFAAHVRFTKPRSEPKEGTEHGTRSSRILVAPTGVFAAVHRTAIGPSPSPQADAYSIVLVPGPGRAGRAAGAIAEELAEARIAPANDAPPHESPPVVSSDDQAIAAALERTRAVVVVVPQRATCRALRLLEEELRVAPCIERRVVLLVD